MIAIKIHQHLIIYQLGDTTCIWPLDTETDVGLLHLIKIVIDHNVGPALQSIFYKFFQAGKLILGNLGYILSQAKTILAEVSVKIFGLVIFPFEFLELNPVLSELHRTYLPIRCKTPKKGDAGNQD